MKNFVYIKAALCLLAICGITGCGGSSLKASDTQFLLNTFITLTADCDDEVLEAAFELCREYEALFSRTDEKSEISRLNASGKATVSKASFDVIERALFFGEKSGGKFDITVCPVTELWDFNNQIVPSRDEIAAALPSVDYESVEISGDTVSLNGARLDLGGIAKGYIADRLLEFFSEKGVEQGIINLGGNVAVFGDRDYNVSVKKPFSEDEISATLKLRNKSVVTSGIYERYIEKDDDFYHHILNPKTGFPAETDLYSATVVCDSAMDADALATVCVLLGESEALSFMEGFEGAEAILINKENKISHTSGLILEGEVYKLM